MLYSLEALINDKNDKVSKNETLVLFEKNIETE